MRRTRNGRLRDSNRTLAIHPNSYDMHHLRGSQWPKDHKPYRRAVARYVHTPFPTAKYPARHAAGASYAASPLWIHAYLSRVPREIIRHFTPVSRMAYLAQPCDRPSSCCFRQPEHIREGRLGAFVIALLLFPINCRSLGLCMSLQFCSC
jgi:hypothetical protein